MKKKIIIVLIVVLFIACGYFIGTALGIFSMPGFLRHDSTEMTDLERISKVLKDSKPTDIFILGDDIKFEVDIKTKSIKKLNEKIIQDTAATYKVIIINDLNKGVVLSDEEIDFAKKFINQNGNLLIYLGNNYVTAFDDPEKETVDINGNLFYSYYSWDKEARRNIGRWLQSDQNELEKYPFSLGQSLLYCIEEYLQEGAN